MRTRVIAALGAGLVLVAGAISAEAAPSIEMFGINPNSGRVDFGVCQGSVVPGGAPLRLSIYAHLGGRAPETAGAGHLFVFERGPNGEDRNDIFVPEAPRRARLVGDQLPERIGLGNLWGSVPGQRNAA
jgi:hypothetical protein